MEIAKQTVEKISKEIRANMYSNNKITHIDTTDTVRNKVSSVTRHIRDQIDNPQLMSIEYNDAPEAVKQKVAVIRDLVKARFNSNYQINNPENELNEKMKIILERAKQNVMRKLEELRDDSEEYEETPEPIPGKAYVTPALALSSASALSSAPASASAPALASASAPALIMRQQQINDLKEQLVKKVDKLIEHIESDGGDHAAQLSKLDLDNQITELANKITNK
jgi:hypothetical protein